MRLASLNTACLALGLALIASCGKDNGDNGLTGKNYVHTINSNICTETSVLIAPTAKQLEEASALAGLCPATLPLGAETSTLIKTCNPRTQTSNGMSTTVTTKIYSPAIASDGSSAVVTEAQATQICTQLETAN